MARKPPLKRARDGNDDALDSQRPKKRIVYDESALFYVWMCQTDLLCNSIADFENTITVLVGSEEKRFMLHQDAVCAQSKFFQAACSNKWREGQEKVVRLPEVEPVHFKVYCDWIYSDEVSEVTATQEEESEEKAAEDKRLMEIYVLGDTLDDVALRNRVVLMFWKRMRSYKFLPSAEVWQWVWGSLPQGSLMRRMVVDVLVSRLCRKDFALKVSQYPPELVQEIAVATMEATPTKTWDHIAERVQQYQEGAGAA